MGDIIPFSTTPENEKSTKSNEMASNSSGFPEGYALFEDGVYQMPAEELDEAPVLICSPIRVDATFSDQNGKGWGRLITVRNRDSVWIDVSVTNARLERFPSEVVGLLVDAGLELAPDKKSRDRLLTLIKKWKPGTRMCRVTRTGWVDKAHTAFVIGNDVIGAANVLPQFNVPAGMTLSGTTDSWKQNVGEKCRGNPNMILAVCLALSGPLLAVLGMTGGGLHFRGASSSGKTTLLHLAASAWGSPQLIRQWRATSNGLEGIAAAMNDMVLPLDEIAEISARVLGETIYMLANGVGKTRMTEDAQLSDTSQWRVPLISSGEISIEEKLKEARHRHMQGHEVRLIDVEADAGRFGVFDNPHGAASAAVFAEQIQAASKEHHGAVGRAFVKMLIGLIEHGDVPSLQVFMENFRTHVMKGIRGNPDGQVSRVAQRFAVLALAGHLATKWGLTGWEEREAFKAAQAAFFEWHDRRYGAKHDDLAKIIAPLQQFLAANINALPIVGTLVPTGTVLGWHDTIHVYLYQDTWHLLFPEDLGTRAAKALIEAGLMLPGDNGRTMRRAPRAIPGRPRLYTLHREKVLGYKLT